MNVPTALLLQTVPYATVVVVSETDEERQQLLLVAYVSLLGLLISLFAILDDDRSRTPLFNIMVENAFRVARQGLSSGRSWLLANRRWTGGRRLSLVKRGDQVVDKGSR